MSSGGGSSSSEFKQEKLSALQKNLLVRWINTLDVCENYLTLENMIEELKSGILLCNILKFHQPNLDFTGVNSKARAKKQCLNNIEKALSILYQKGAAPRYIPTADEIFEGDKFTDKIWILLRTIFDVFAMHDVGLLLLKIVKWINKSLSYFPGREQISGDPDEIYQDFKSGVNLACILYLYGPQDNEDFLPDFRMIYEHPQNRQELMNNLSYIFNLAIKNNVPIYLKPTEYLDFDQHNFLLLQLYYLYCKFKNSKPSFSRRSDPPPQLIFKDDGRILEDNSQTSGGQSSNATPQHNVSPGPLNLQTQHTQQSNRHMNDQYSEGEGQKTQTTNSMGVIDEVDSVEFSSTMKSSLKQEKYGGVVAAAAQKQRQQQPQKAVQNPPKQEAVLQQQNYKKGQQQQRNSYEDDGNVEEDEDEMEGEEEEEKEEEEMDYRYAGGNQRRQYQDEYGVQKPPTPQQKQQNLMQKSMEAGVKGTSQSSGMTSSQGKSQSQMRTQQSNNSVNIAIGAVGMNGNKRQQQESQQLQNTSMNKADQSLRQYHAIVDENIGIFSSRIEDQTLNGSPTPQHFKSPSTGSTILKQVKQDSHFEERKAFFLEDLRSQVSRLPSSAASALIQNSIRGASQPISEDQLQQMFYSSVGGVTVNQTAQFTNNFNTIVDATPAMPSQFNAQNNNYQPQMQSDQNSAVQRQGLLHRQREITDENGDLHEIKCLQVLMIPHTAIVQTLGQNQQTSSSSQKVQICLRPADSFYSELMESYMLRVSEILSSEQMQQGKRGKVIYEIRISTIESILMKNIIQKQFVVTWNQNTQQSNENLSQSGATSKSRLAIETIDKSDLFFQALTFMFQKVSSIKRQQQY